ncbi:hypothetical protein [Brachybacterium fresconis]|uniref:UDP-N-acetylmuramyl pentapeptide phosphotransferase/UDP-N-acetylglucosamine-1-phosphate transferase n=1 Tax=Brachybacterium fresconis TaxID=173363 RepID=A0ABS4YEZ2_9MICO|nr:UDP-N-acetylmuramyl pentapeptide phosphotransferase/UDP-N-acetylglucosamine-1-phosphate transferase [Brachybacterium fresconis]
MSAPREHDGRGLLDPVLTELRRTNFAGRPVSLLEGALVVTAAGTIALRRGAPIDAAVLSGIGLLGWADDLLEPRQRRSGHPVSKGLRGHLGALRRGSVTTGAAKAFGIPALALVGAAMAPRPRRGGMILADAALAAGCANLANLLDLRPGRALKVVLPAAAALAARPPAADVRARSGRSLALAALVPGALALPTDLREAGMLGDAGANVLGAAMGTAAARTLPVPGRLALLSVVVALTLASERVSFSAVIDATPALRALDRLGRRDPGSGDGTGTASGAGAEPEQSPRTEPAPANGSGEEQR